MQNIIKTFRLFSFVAGALALGTVYCHAQESPSPSKAEGAATAGSSSGSVLKADTEFDGVAVELTSVKRGDGDTVTVQFKYVNTGSKEVTVAPSQLGGYASEQVYYIDPKNKKKYTVITDSERNPVASNMRGSFSLEPGSSRSGWTKLPAPPADVSKITVYIPGAPPFESVPLAP